jgi:hypothetical protein
MQFTINLHYELPRVRYDEHGGKHTMKRRNPIDEGKSLSHSNWEYKYLVVFIPKCRRRTLCGQLRQHLRDVLRCLVVQKESIT